MTTPLVGNGTGPGAGHRETVLSRRTDAAPAAPIRLLHLGLGGFARSHQAWYTHHAPDAQEWGIAGFTGSSSHIANALATQEGLFTLVTRGSEGDAYEVVTSISAAHAGGEHEAWLEYWERPELAVVTLTVTEAGYAYSPNGTLDETAAHIRADIDTLRRDPRAPVRSAPARLLAGLHARTLAGETPVAIVSCDNLPDNGSITARVVSELAEAVNRPELRVAATRASYVSTVVDRITPWPSPQDVADVTAATGRIDAAPVVTEPYMEWVLSGDFPGGRPRWEAVGARFTDDVTPYAQRKLWLLNGGHSLLAYVGSARGHATVADAVADPLCHTWLAEWWAEAGARLEMQADDLATYQRALLNRFANPRIRHALAKIAEDGSQKLRARVVPVLRAARAQGAEVPGAVVIVASWVLHLRGVGAPVSDAGAPDGRGTLRDTTKAALACLDPALAGDAALVNAVAQAAAVLGQTLG